jgi:integrase
VTAPIKSATRFRKRPLTKLKTPTRLVAPLQITTVVRADTPCTVGDAVQYWLRIRQGQIKVSTFRDYKQVSQYIVGPLLVGTKLDRHRWNRSRSIACNAQFIELLGSIRLDDLSTSLIRDWHKLLSAHTSQHVARVAKKHLRTALTLVAEDFRVSVPPMPSRCGRGRERRIKTILSPDQVGILLHGAAKDVHKGIYYVFPFLTGVRPSEQLALQWRDVHLELGTIHIRRMVEQDGRLCEFTKTAAGMREIPLSPVLSEMLRRWQSWCPSSHNPLGHVFPCLGRSGWASKKRGSQLSYVNFLNNYWRPGLLALGLPYVTPHSARHVFISTLQAQGVEVGLVAKLAGHANPTVTLSHYTQAVRGGESAVRLLDMAYASPREGWER